jgi:hypothetical protein
MAVSVEYAARPRGGSHTMSQPQPISAADLDLAAWTAETGTDFETAEWILGALIAWCSVRTVAERAREHPDPDRLAGLDAKCADYLSTRRSLSVRDPRRIREVISRYSALARECYRELANTPYPPESIRRPRRDFA